MNIILKSFNKFISEIWCDIMLSVVLVVPILAGIVFKFIIPLAENYLCRIMNTSTFLSPYYGIFDILLMFLPSLMFCFASVMVILEQLDSGISKYLVVTPLGKSGYIMSQIGIPSVICFFYSIILCVIFKLSYIPLSSIILISIISVITGICLSLLIIAFSHNKIEGMALTKFSSFIIIGAIIPFFVESNMKYLCMLLPTFWVSEFFIEGSYIFIIAGLLLSSAICYYSYKKFEKKII